MHLLFIIFIILLVVGAVGLSIVGFIIKSIFGIGRRFSFGPRTSEYKHTTNERTSDYRQGNTSYSSDSDYSSRSSHSSRSDYSSRGSYSSRGDESSYTNPATGKKQKKIFTEDDGEYVDFEEIKD